MSKLPKLNLVCANDELRPAMNHVLVTKEFVVASDSYTLVRFETNKLFCNEFIEKMPSEFFIHKEEWKKLTKKFKIVIINDDGYIEIFRDGYTELIKPILPKKDFKFPNFQEVLSPKRLIPESLGAISFNVNKLNNVYKAMGLSTSQIISIFHGERYPMLIKSNTIDDTQIAILMPSMINSDIYSLHEEGN